MGETRPGNYSRNPSQKDTIEIRIPEMSDVSCVTVAMRECGPESLVVLAAINPNRISDILLRHKPTEDRYTRESATANMTWTNYGDHI